MSPRTPRSKVRREAERCWPLIISSVLQLTLSVRGQRPSRGSCVRCSPGARSPAPAGGLSTSRRQAAPGSSSSRPPQGDFLDFRPGSGARVGVARRAVGVVAARGRGERLPVPRGMEEAPLPPRESARLVAERSRDVRVDPEGVRRAAELLLPAAAAWRVRQWKDLHELNPRGADEAALAWVFVVDSLNFSFWAEREERRCEVRYGGAAYTGYWALCAAVNRALDRGIPITSASYYATVTLDQVRDIFRSDTAVPMPLLEERHRILNETGKILLEKFGGSFLNCVQRSEKSAQKLMHLVVENFPSYRDETQFEGKRISFYKRAQILVADTWSVLEGRGDGCFEDISSITMFADYRVPQTLVYLGALKYSDELLKRLLRGEMLSNGEKQEVEIRGCSIWCVELIRDCLLELLEERGEKPQSEINSILLDYHLWDYARDHREAMRGIPFHRTRCIYY